MSILFELYILLVVFILPFELVNIVTISFSLFSMVLFGFSFVKNCKSVTTLEPEEKKLFFLLACLTLSYLIIVFFSPYSFIFTSELYANILCGYIYFYHFEYRGVSRFFRFAAFLSVLVQLLYCLSQGEIFVLWSITQKSVSTAVVFLLMCIEYKYKNRITTIIYFIELVIISSQQESGYSDNRTSFLVLIVFCLSILIQWWFSKTGKHEVRNLWIVEKSARYFIISVIFIYFFSLGWVKITQAIGYTGYHASLFDNSNNVRFASDLYVFHQFLSEKELLIFGYDQDIFDVMDLGIGDTFLHYMDARVVYVHHSVLSLYQRSGLLFTILYFAVMSIMLDHSKLKIRNEVLLPIFAIGLIMHSYLQTESLLMILIVLNANYDKVRQKKAIPGYQTIPSTVPTTGVDQQVLLE